MRACAGGGAALKKKSFRVWLILLLLWTALIFVQSSLPATASRAESGGLFAWVQTLLPWMTHTLLRKIAHFAEFAVLGVLATGTFYRAKHFLLLKPLSCSLMIALSDETIQLFSAGRAGLIKDVWLDFCGAVCGTLLMWLIFRLCRK